MQVQAKKIVRAVVWGFFILWPVLLFFSLYSDVFWLFAWGSLALFLLRLALPPVSSIRVLSVAERVATLLGAGICVISLAFKISIALLWYPVALNIVLLITCLISLFCRPNIVEFLIQTIHQKESVFREVNENYAKIATFAWIVFFFLSSIISALTALIADPKLWTLWNGIFVYILAGLLTAGEFFVWMRLRKP